MALLGNCTHNPERKRQAASPHKEVKAVILLSIPHHRLSGWGTPTAASTTTHARQVTMGTHHKHYPTAETAVVAAAATTATQQTVLGKKFQLLPPEVPLFSEQPRRRRRPPSSPGTRYSSRHTGQRKRFVLLNPFSAALPTWAENTWN